MIVGYANYNNERGGRAMNVDQAMKVAALEHKLVYLSNKIMAYGIAAGDKEAFDTLVEAIESIGLFNISLGLKSLCKQYDKQYGSYPESYLEGEAVYRFFCKKNNLKCDTHNWLIDEFPKDWDMI